MNKPPVELPPAPLYPDNGGLYDTDVYVTTFEEHDIYWASAHTDVLVVWGGDGDELDTWSPGTGWDDRMDIPESVKRFAESIYHLHQ